MPKKETAKEDHEVNFSETTLLEIRKWRSLHQGLLKLIERNERKSHLWLTVHMYKPLTFLKVLPGIS